MTRWVPLFPGPLLNSFGSFLSLRQLLRTASVPGNVLCFGNTQFYPCGHEQQNFFLFLFPQLNSGLFCMCVTASLFIHAGLSWLWILAMENSGCDRHETGLFSCTFIISTEILGPHCSPQVFWGAFRLTYDGCTNVHAHLQRVAFSTPLQPHQHLPVPGFISHTGQPSASSRNYFMTLRGAESFGDLGQQTQKAFFE